MVSTLLHCDMLWAYILVPAAALATNFANCFSLHFHFPPRSTVILGWLGLQKLQNQLTCRNIPKTLQAYILNHWPIFQPHLFSSRPFYCSTIYSCLLFPLSLSISYIKFLAEESLRYIPFQWKALRLPKQTMKNYRPPKLHKVNLVLFQYASHQPLLK